MRLYLATTFLAPAPTGVAAVRQVSNDKTQITFLILGQGVLSIMSIQIFEVKE